MFEVKDRINFSALYSGIDCAENCFDKKHFENYTKKISYQYNSKGFRDNEWPVDLSDVIWCVGDNFTAGIGQPYEETWPQLLQKKTGKRCINLGQDGCSNDSLTLRIKEIVKNHKPKLIVVMWSYFARRRFRDGKNVHFDKDARELPKHDLQNFADNFSCVNKLPTKIIHTIIPGAFMVRKHTYDDLTEYAVNRKLEHGKKIIHFKQMDCARDYHHFDIKTSELVTDLITKKITDIDNSSK